MASRPWETRSTTDKELNSDHASVKSTASRSISLSEINKAYSRHNLNPDNKQLSPAGQKLSRASSRQSPSTPPSKAPSTTTSVGGKMRPPSPRGSGCCTEDDSRSLLSVQSERWRRHSIAGSSVGDDESLASSPAVPSYMAPTQSAKARSRLPSPLGFEKNGTPEKLSSVGSAKKRLSFSPSTVGPRRHSGPPRVDSSSIKDIAVDT